MGSIPYMKRGTFTDKALKLADSELFTAAGGDRADKPNVLLVFTDGNTNLNSEPYYKILPPLKVF